MYKKPKNSPKIKKFDCLTLSQLQSLSFPYLFFREKKKGKWNSGRKGEKSVFALYSRAMNLWRQAGQIQTGGCKHKTSMSQALI